MSQSPPIHPEVAMQGQQNFETWGQYYQAVWIIALDGHWPFE